VGRFEFPVIAGALIWLTHELIVLMGPSEFRDAQYYVLGARCRGRAGNGYRKPVVASQSEASRPG